MQLTSPKEVHLLCGICCENSVLIKREDQIYTFSLSSQSQDLVTMSEAYRLTPQSLTIPDLTRTHRADSCGSVLIHAWTGDTNVLRAVAMLCLCRRQFTFLHRILPRPGLGSSRKNLQDHEWCNCAVTYDKTNRYQTDSSERTSGL